MPFTTRQYISAAVCSTLTFLAASVFPVGASQSSLQLAQTGTTAIPPGQITSDDTAVRALERALVSTGLLLLPSGKAELEPMLGYVRVERDAPVLVDVGGQQLAARQRVNTDIFEASVLLRFGLPSDTQLELSVPYQYVSDDYVTELDFQTTGAQSDSDSGVGDIRIGLAKGLTAESASRPNLVGRLTWDTGTGDTGGTDVSLGGTGSNELEVSLSATKRQDPLVFVGEFFYENTLDVQDDVKPGDRLGLSLGALLAASPDTSLRVTLNQLYAQEVRVGGSVINGSDTLIASLLVGASAVLGDGQFLDFSVQAGLTEDAPAYGFSISFTTRFDARRR